MTTGRSLAVAACSALLSLAALFAGCARGIGDSCQTNVECSPLGDRVCDTGSPNGYCTVEGCSYQSCPNNGNCVRFYTLQRNGHTCKLDTDCNPYEKCICDDAACKAAYCALESSERRWCMHDCNQDSDCRQQDGYKCYTTGSNGSLAVPYRDPNTLMLVMTPCPTDGSPAPPNCLPQLNYCAPVPQ